MNNQFEYSGGGVWALEEEGDDDYGKTVLSLEIDKGKVWIIDQGRKLTDEENTALVNLLRMEGILNGKWKY